MNRQERIEVNNKMKRAGLGGLDDPTIIHQVAYMVRDHVHFRQILTAVEPEKRTLAYESMKPYLRFEPKALDVYIAEAADLAARREYSPSAIDILAEKAIAQSLHEKEGGLTVVCEKCTKIEIFRGANRDEAERDAHAAGWRSEDHKNWCPGCVPTRCKMILNCQECRVVLKLRAWDPQDGYRDARRLGWTITDAALCPDCTLKLATQ